MFRNYIAGECVACHSANLSINPSNTADVIGEYAEKAHAVAAIEAASSAQGAWSRCSPEVRSDALDRIGSGILTHSDALGYLLSREEGKTLPEGVGEVGRAGCIFKLFAAEALRIGKLQLQPP